MNDKAREAFEACPFCGLVHTLKLTSAQEIAQEGEDEPEPWEHSDSYTVVCDASRPNGPGGCGAQGGFKLTPAEAVTAWNSRAALQWAASQQAAPGERTPKDYAIEHAGYLAVAAEDLLTALDERDAIVLRREESDDVEEDTVYDADVTLSENIRALRQYIYEFRKRRDRASQLVTRDRIRAIFLAAGFTVKEGQTDLKPYVYEAAEALLREASQPTQAEAPSDPLWPVDGLYPDMQPPATSRDRWMYDQGRLAERRIAATHPAPEQVSREALAKAMADKLMGWKLPESFSPDCFITFDRERATRCGSWPVGTNLLTHQQAVDMLLAILPAGVAHREDAEAATAYQSPIFLTAITALNGVKAWRDSDGNEGFPHDTRTLVDAVLMAYESRAAREAQATKGGA